MEPRRVFSFLLSQHWSSGCVYWISCDRAQADLALATIADSLAVGEGLILQANLKRGGLALLWDLLAVLEALPSGLSLVESDLEFLLLELPGTLAEKFRRKTLWVRLRADAEADEARTTEALAVLRLATTILADSLRFIVLDSVGEVQDYERMGVVANLQQLEEEAPEGPYARLGRPPKPGPAIEEKYTSIKELFENGKEKGYLLHDEIYQMLPVEMMSLPDELDETYSRFADLGIAIVDRPECYRSRAVLGEAGVEVAQEHLRGEAAEDPWDSGRDIDLYSVKFETGELIYRPRGEARARPIGEGLGADSEADIILIAHPESQRLGSRFNLSPGSALEIGRSSSVRISLPEVLSLSRKHARLRYRGAAVTIEDLGSSYGTYVNGYSIHGRTVLRSGDRIQTGAVHFKFLHEQDAESAYHLAIYELVTRDGLTEIFTKRKYEEEVQREFSRAVRHRRPLSLIIFDLDDFKQINDRHGHLCGDFILKQVASLARELVRPEQILARMGGDEFVILAPETAAAGAEALATKLCDRLVGLDYRYGDLRLSITCSFGLAELAPGMSNPQGLYQAADSALLQAKRGGHNRVAVFPTSPSHLPAQ